MSTTFILPFRVALYDLDSRDELSCANLFRYFEETAMRASTALGFTLDWYNRQGQFWVIRTMRMERTCPALYEQELTVRTWVSSMSRLRADRNYEARTADSGRLLARGVANWVYLDMRSLQPARIAPEIVARFTGLEPPALPPLSKLVLSEPDAALCTHGSERPVQFYEADSARRVNNAVYVDWLEEAVRQTLTEMGHVLSMDRACPAPWFYRHALEYLRPAVPGERVSIQTSLVKRGRTSGVWEHHIRHEPGGDLILRASSTTLWIDVHNCPIPWPRL